MIFKIPSNPKYSMILWSWKRLLRSLNKHSCSSHILVTGLYPPILQFLFLLYLKSFCSSRVPFVLRLFCPSFDDPVVQTSSGFLPLPWFKISLLDEVLKNKCFVFFFCYSIWGVWGMSRLIIWGKVLYNIWILIIFRHWENRTKWQSVRNLF